MENQKKNAKRWLVAALVLCLVSMIGASLMQTSGGRVTVKDIRWETGLGAQMSGLLFVPKGVSAENKAPAIVVSHGMFNNREMQDANYVELSRRGFVVLSQDMPSHGNSESYTDNVGGIVIGLYESVKMLASLPYVDTSRIGITGHSMGGMSSNAAVGIDSAMPVPLISAVLLNCADATYIADEGLDPTAPLPPSGNYFNFYGSRHAGIIAAQYDEFFMRQEDGAGGQSIPRNFVQHSMAQSFLYFGTDPANREKRLVDTVYRQNVDGREAIRVIYNPPIIHPWSHFSKKSTIAAISFFDTALKAPSPIAPANQIWQWKVFFNLLGLIGFGIFIVSFTVLMTFTSFFASLRAESPVKPMQGNKSNFLYLFGGLLIIALFSAVIYIPVMIVFHGFTVAKEITRQSVAWGMGLWSVFNGIFVIILLILVNRFFGKKYGFNLAERGLTLTKAKIGKTVLLALVTGTVSYSLVFFADFFFKADFRFWLVGIKAFTSDKILLAVFPYFLFFLIFYVASSTAINSFNHITIGKYEWINTCIVTVLVSAGVWLLLLVQYIGFGITGETPVYSPGWGVRRDSVAMVVVWLIPVAVYLPVSAVISRKIYRVTNNPYLPGLINAIMITMLTCTNTLTWS
ncbi:MAG: alpha/beta fold hydrolase [Treponema sp.]|jgi:hypothetical protein|nr:alpha/beta fold hydrolase [Treponema sp.]